MQPDFEREDIDEGPSLSQRGENNLHNSMRLDQSMQSIGGGQHRDSKEDVEYTKFKME